MSHQKKLNPKYFRVVFHPRHASLGDAHAANTTIPRNTTCEWCHGEIAEGDSDYERVYEVLRGNYHRSLRCKQEARDHLFQRIQLRNGSVQVASSIRPKRREQRPVV